MARKQTLDAIISLYKKLGGNTSEVLGTKTNVNFLGKGKSPELMLDMDINQEALAVLPQSKAVEELTNSVGYAVSGKLNDIQANQLLKNMQTMESVYFPPAAPANITDLASRTEGLTPGGLETLRKYADDLPPPGSRGGADDIASPVDIPEGVDIRDTILPTGQGLELLKNVKNNNLIIDDVVDTIYMNIGVSKAAQPAARGNAREFLNRIKDLEDPSFPSGPTLSSVMEADDFKFMTEGGGGGMGDPMLLVQKYFGPKVASAVAQLDNADDIQKFAENLVKIKDAKGNTITSRSFDPDTVDPEDFEFADGGRVPAADSQLVKESDEVLGYRGDAAYRSGSEQASSIGQGNVGTKSDFGEGPPQGGGGGGNNNQNTYVPPVTPFVEKDDVVNKVPVKIGLEGIMSDNAKLKAFLDLQDSLKEQELAGQVDFTGNIGGLDIGASATLGGDKSLNLGYQTKGGTNLGFTTDLDNNAMFTLNRSFADGGRVPFFAGMLVRGGRMGYQALRKYGIEGKDISRLYASLGTDKSLVGKEKTEYFRMLNKVLKNPDDYPDEIMDIQKQLGLDVGLGFRNGGLAGILEV
jgi:hypothetical protein